MLYRKVLLQQCGQPHLDQASADENASLFMRALHLASANRLMRCIDGWWVYSTIQFHLAVDILWQNDILMSSGATAKHCQKIWLSSSSMILFTVIMTNSRA